MACRLGKDIQYLRQHVNAQTNGQAIVTEVDDNMQFLLLTLLPNDGFYKGARLRFKINFSESYPEEMPLVHCLDQVYHPNIDPQNEVEFEPEYSNVCVSLLDEWDSSMGLDHVVLALLFLLYNPNPEDALSPYFDECLDMEDLKLNIRQALRGEVVEGQDWPRLLVEEEEGEGDASGGEKGTPVDGKSAMQSEADNKLVADDDSQVQSRKEEGDTAHDPEELAKSEATVSKPPAPTENCLATVLAPSTDSGTSVDGQDCDGQNVSLSDATVSADSDGSFSKMSLLDNRHNSAPTDVVTPNFNKDFPLIFLDAGAGCDCNKNSDSKSFTDSLSIARLFSTCTSSCTCRAFGSRIKTFSFFSCFRQRDATLQFQTTNTGILDAFEDCDVD